MMRSLSLTGERVDGERMDSLMELYGWREMRLIMTSLLDEKGGE